MLTFKQAFDCLRTRSTTAGYADLRDLILALDSDESYDLSRLYGLGRTDFDLAMALLGGWRLAGYLYPRGSLARLLVADPEKRDSVSATGAAHGVTLAS